VYEFIDYLFSLEIKAVFLSLNRDIAGKRAPTLMVFSM